MRARVSILYQQGYFPEINMPNPSKLVELYRKFYPVVIAQLRKTRAFGEEAKAEAEASLKYHLMQVDPTRSEGEVVNYLNESVGNDIRNFMTKDNAKGFTFREWGTAGEEGINRKPQMSSLMQDIPGMEGKEGGRMIDLVEDEGIPSPQRQDLSRDVRNAINKLPEGKRSSQILKMMLDPKYDKSLGVSEKQGAGYDMQAMADALGVSHVYLTQELKRIIENPPKQLLKFAE